VCYYFNFNFYDLDSEDVELYVDWELWDSTHNMDYSEGDVSLESGTYYLKTSKYGHLINTTTLDTGTYGNSTIDIYLNMKRHQSCSNGFIASNDTVSSVTVHAETPQLLNFTIDGNTPAQLGVGVAKNASHIVRSITLSSTFSVQESKDDAIEFGSGIQDYTQDSNHAWSFTDLENANYRCAGLRFADVDIPKGAVLLSANFSSYIYDGAYDDANFDIYGNKVTDALNFYDDKNIITRSRTTASVPWVQNSIGLGWKESPDFKDVLQEIIDQDEWSSGNALVLLLIAKTDITKHWLGYSYDKNPAKTPKLNVKYHLNGNFTGWKYDNSPSHIHFNQSSFSTFAFHFPSTTGPVVGPHTPMNNRVKVNVRLNGEWLKGANVTVEGGPDNRIEWGLTDPFGGVKFKLATGSYEIVASYEQYRKGKSIYVSTHMTVSIDLTKEDIISPDVIPEDVKDFFEELASWVNLPELDLTTETMLVFILPLIVLVGYALKKASEGPKRKWKYSYLK